MGIIPALTLLLFTVIVNDAVGDVPDWCADMRIFEGILTVDQFYFRMDIENFTYQTSSPYHSIILFMDTDNDSSTGWDNTGYAFEDEISLPGSDVMMKIECGNPSLCHCYRLFAGGENEFWEDITVNVENHGETIRLTTNLELISTSRIKICIFILEDGNFFDKLPESGNIVIPRNSLIFKKIRDMR
ncbi:MAG TPA: hypothetical protein ENL43_03600 [candidate division WOR-3 bacterium]|uniref:Uncharacterized protein n=1 Tax=candidate division WOR-3 bacterium TaxID=2052148 RepID=A0A7V5LTL6_UNCW3|nr:hypothetical protein [candidate division WOR-3 bacterium]